NNLKINTLIQPRRPKLTIRPTNKADGRKKTFRRLSDIFVKTKFITIIFNLKSNHVSENV
ncbi:hypothetical protein, partial [Muribaculum sp.]|uniref:hypothetical protein n=1 Tax=Muribaculum sp. TaxID=1918611 RepID=UPI00257D4ECC